MSQHWADELADLIKVKGANSEIRFLEGSLSSIIPFRFRADIGAGESGQLGELGAVFLKSAVDGAAVGDLVFFTDTIEGRSSRVPSHVGIVTKKGYMVNLQLGGCLEERYDTGYWAKFFNAYGQRIQRVL